MCNRRNTTLPYPVRDVINTSAERTMRFQNIKMLAIHQLGSELLKTLQLMRLTSRCVERIAVDPPVDPSLFSWSFADFLERCQRPIAWCAALQNYMQLSCLEKRKQLEDFDELERHIYVIIQGYLNYDNYKDEIEGLSGALHYFTFERELLEEQEANFNKFSQARNGLIALKFIRPIIRAAKATTIRNLLFMTKKFSNAMSTRYENNYHLIRQELCQYGWEKCTAKLEETLSMLKKKTEIEFLASQSAVQKYALDGDDLHSKISDFSLKYETEMLHLLDKIGKTKKGLYQFKLRTKYLSEEMMRFREEVQNEKARRNKMNKETINERAVPKKRTRKKLQKKKKAQTIKSEINITKNDSNISRTP